MSGQPYYADERVTLWHGDCLEVMAGMADRSVDAVITDPPFDARTHANARTNNSAAPPGGRVLSGYKGAFEAFTHQQQRDLFATLGRLTRGWVVSSLSTDTAFRFEIEPPDGLRCLRVAVWVKTNPMPIPSADRPAMGWEPVVCLHRDDVKPTWNWGGKSINYVGPTSQGSGHPTQKPLPMVASWVRAFTKPGDTIFDPFAGSGTTLRAALDEGRKVVGVEIDERYCEMTARRLSQDVLDFGESA